MTSQVFSYGTEGGSGPNKMYRYDIINAYIKKRFSDSCRYLEIGVRNPEDCFNKILANEKTAVDPCFEFNGYEPDYKMTSDQFFAEFFAGNTKLPVDYKWDIVFIDGLHLAQQVFVDLQNALKCVSENALIFLHDCNPPHWKTAHSDYNDFLRNPSIWNGTAWKALYFARTRFPYKIITVNDDHGVGVVDLSQKADPIQHTNYFFDYGLMKSRREHFLGLVSVEDFLKNHVQ